MTDELPVADLPPDPEQRAAEPRPPERRVSRPRAKFQWPPECLWPFVDRGWDREN
jgi:hypothetical protein